MNHPAPSALRRTVSWRTSPASFLAVVTLALVASAFQTPPACAAGGAAEGAAFSSAMGHFQKAAAGQSAEVDAAADAFKALSDAQPADPVLRAYAGAATSMRATTTWMPWRKMSFAEDGLAQIDKALAQLTPTHDAPLHQGVAASLEARFVAASTFLSLPGMFNRGPRGEQLLADVLKSPLLDAAPLPFRGAVWLRAGQEAAKAGRAADARQWFDKVVASGAPQAAAAQAKRQEL